MSRLTPEIALRRARLVRPLSSYTPAQRRLLLALIEADATPPSSVPDPRCGTATTRSRART